MADLTCTERDKDSAKAKPRGRGLENCVSSSAGAPSLDSPAGWRAIPSSSGVSTMPVYGPEILSGVLERASSGTDASDPFTGPPKGLPISKWPLKEKFAEVLRRTGPKLPGEMKDQFMALLTPVNLGIMAGTLAAWAVSQFFGIGEIIDILLLIVGGIFLGMAIFTVAKDLWSFAKGTVDAQTEADLDEAAKKLAEAIAIIGIAAFIALLAKLGGKLAKGAPKEEAPPPPPDEFPKKPPDVEKPPEGETPAQIAKPKPKSLREKYMGRTPGKNSRTGREVIQRMRKEGKIRDDLMGNPVEFQDTKGDWHPMAEGDMSHKVDAVKWWNDEGRYYGPKSPEVRDFMKNPDNYEIDYFKINRSKGAKLPDRYEPPAPGPTAPHEPPVGIGHNSGDSTPIPDDYQPVPDDFDD